MSGRWRWRPCPVVLTLVVSTAVCSALGFAPMTVIPSENGVPAVTDAIVLPLRSFPGILMHDDSRPTGVKLVGPLFHVRRSFQAQLTAFKPATLAPGIAWHHSAILAAWVSGHRRSLHP